MKQFRFFALAIVSMMVSACPYAVPALPAVGTVPAISTTSDWDDVTQAQVDAATSKFSIDGGFPAGDRSKWGVVLISLRVDGEAQIGYATKSSRKVMRKKLTSSVFTILQGDEPVTFFATKGDLKKEFEQRPGQTLDDDSKKRIAALPQY